MHPTVTIVDYGRSNLLSVQRALEYCGAAVEYASTPEQVFAAGALVLPGVGAFADGMNLLRESGLARAVCTRARQGVPLLGICLGMQFLFDSSSEGGLTPGLGLLPGTVEAIPGHTTQGQPLRVPHIGWAPLYPAQQREGFLGSTLEAIPTKSQVYFVHGYRAMPARPTGWRTRCMAGTESVPPCSAAILPGYSFTRRKAARWASSFCARSWAAARREDRG